MKPHINIGTIGHIDHGKTTLTATSASTAMQSIVAEQHETAPVIAEDRPRSPTRRSAAIGMLALSAMLGVAGFHGCRCGYSSHDRRHDPGREKTPEDMERMAKAQRKRERKAARKSSANDQVEARRK